MSSSTGINTAFAGNRYFTVSEGTSTFLGVQHGTYPYLKPKPPGTVNVYKDMVWSNLGSDKSEVPQIGVIEKELEYGTWATQLANLLVQGKNLLTQADLIDQNKTNNEAVDIFVKLYAAKETGFYYNFPWLLKGGSTIRNLENNWKSTQGLGSLLDNKAPKGSVGELLGAGVGAVIGAMTPGFGFEDTKQYDSTSQQTLTIEFPLYNTIDLESAFNHFSFVNLFTFQSLKTRTTLMTFIPPKIYEVDAYSVGGIYMAAAIVSNFKVDSIGTTRRMKDWESFGSKEILIPEAYKVSITFQDLLSQSSNVFAGAMGGSKIKIADDITGEALDILGTVGTGALDIVQGGLQAANDLINGP